jgi:cysteine-rich repeat protein
LAGVAGAALLAAAGSANAGSEIAYWVSDDTTRTIYQIAPDGSEIFRFSSMISTGGAPFSVAISELANDPADNTLWAVTEVPGRVVHYRKRCEPPDCDGFMISLFGTDRFALGVEGIAVDTRRDRLWIVTDPLPGSGDVAMVFNLTKEGEFIGSFPTSVFEAAAQSPQGIAFDPFDGSLWITDNFTDRIYNVNLRGDLIFSISTKGLEPSSRNPQGIDVDPDGTLWMTDRGTAMRYNIDPSGVQISVSPAVPFDVDAAAMNPSGVVTDSADVGSKYCRDVQLLVQDAAGEEWDWRNHGRRVRAASQVANPAERSGLITDDCHECIMDPIVHKVAIADQEACGADRVCGDGEVDPGEACDDGNTASGDGCSDSCIQEQP